MEPRYVVIKFEFEIQKRRTLSIVFYINEVNAKCADTSKVFRNPYHKIIIIIIIIIIQFIFSFSKIKCLLL